MRIWKPPAIRAMGVANGALGVLGLFITTIAAVRVLSGAIAWPRALWFVKCFSIMLPIELAYYIGCILIGLRLWRGERRGLPLVLWLSCVQLFYTLGIVVVPLFIHDRELSIQIDMATVLVWHALRHTIPVAWALLSLASLPFLYPKAPKGKSSPTGPRTEAGIQQGPVGGQGLPTDSSTPGDQAVAPRSGWASRLIRAFGVVNLIMAILGLPLCVATAFLFPARIPWTPDQPYLAEVFWSMTVINLVFLGLLALSGFLLLKADRRALLVCNLLFTAEILYWIGFPVLGLYLGLFLKNRAWIGGLSTSMAGAFGIGNMGTAPQMLSGYPLIALPALNLAFRRLPRPVAPDLPPAQ